MGFGIGVGYFGLFCFFSSVILNWGFFFVWVFCRSLSSHVFKIEDEMKYLAFTLFSFLLLFFNLCSYS